MSLVQDIKEAIKERIKSKEVSSEDMLAYALMGLLLESASNTELMKCRELESKYKKLLRVIKEILDIIRRNIKCEEKLRLIMEVISEAM